MACINKNTLDKKNQYELAKPSANYVLYKSSLNLLSGVVGWVDGWVGGWLGGWMVGWLDGWVGGLLLIIKLISAQLSYAAAGTGLSLAIIIH